MKDSLVFETLTKKSLDQALTDLKENLQKHKFGVLWELNLKEKLKEKGQEIKDDLIVLEVCNPAHAKDLLEVNAQVGYVLPCKMVVRKENDRTFIGMTSPYTLINYFDDDTMNKIALEVKNTLETVIEETV